MQEDDDDCSSYFVFVKFLTWNILGDFFLFPPFQLAVCFFRNSMTMLCDSIMSWEIKISLEAYLPWLCAASCSVLVLVLQHSAFCCCEMLKHTHSFYHFIPFESISNELFMAVSIPSCVWLIKNESEGMLKSEGGKKTLRFIFWYSVHLLVEAAMKNYSRKWIRWPFVELWRTACWVRRHVWTNACSISISIWMWGWKSL